MKPVRWREKLPLGSRCMVGGLTRQLPCIGHSHDRKPRIRYTSRHGNSVAPSPGDMRFVSSAVCCRGSTGQCRALRCGHYVSTYRLSHDIWTNQNAREGYNPTTRRAGAYGLQRDCAPVTNVAPARAVERHIPVLWHERTRRAKHFLPSYFHVDLLR
jgi:hypothetical protein